MESVKRKRLPYGNSNFESVRTEGYAYVDKTRFIELLEQEGNKNLFFTRPRKFGKSLFFSMLYHYYDICSAEKFPVLFGDLYIGQHPTPKHNELMVLKLNFSGIDTTSQRGFEVSFTGKLQMNIIDFINDHKEVLPDFGKIKQIVREYSSVSELISIPFDISKSLNRKLFIIIDEYDHFANDFIAMGTPEGIDFYKQNIRANGMVRDFYETLKEGSEAVIDRIMLTGITPIMLDDLTSGFNVASNISLKPKYNEILGFTQEEVEWLMKEAGVDDSRIPVDMKQLYDGYKFHYTGKHSVYNSSMMLYFFSELLRTDYKPEYLIDENLKMDYARLRLLLSIDSRRQILSEITHENGIMSEIVPKFSLDKLHDSRNFTSLLFYLGLLTIDDTVPSRLKIPNQSVKAVYWEYLEEMTLEMNRIEIDTTIQAKSLYELAYHNNPKPFLDFMVNDFLSKISYRDLIHFDEKYIKFMMLSRLMQSSLFSVISEPEFSTGYADIRIKRAANRPEIPYEWVWELKYVKVSDNKQIIEEKLSEAMTQLRKYCSSHQLKDRTDVRYLAIVFIGKDRYRMEELK